METRFRTDLLAWLAGDAVLAAGLNAIAEESPVTSPPPWLGIAASASADWGAKSVTGREVRVALELTCRGDDAAATAGLVTALEARIATLPLAQDGYRVVVTQFLRSRAERRAGNIRAVLLEYRFLLISTH